MFFLMTLRQFVRERQPEDESTAGYQMRERGPEHSLEPFTDLMSKIPGLGAVQMCGLSVGRSCVVCLSVTWGLLFSV